jgi:hypothetical protein
MAHSCRRLAAWIAALVLLGQAPLLLAQNAILGVGAGPSFFPGSGAGSDWHAQVSVGVRTRGSLSPRVDLAYMGIPGADLLAVTGSAVWSFRPGDGSRFQSYLMGGAGAYIKFGESRFGLNTGAGVRYPAIGSNRLFLEARYHGVLNRFEEASAVNRFLLLTFGFSLGG